MYNWFSLSILLFLVGDKRQIKHKTHQLCLTEIFFMYKTQPETSSVYLKR